MSTATARRPERVAAATERDQRRRINLRERVERRLALAEHLPKADRLLLQQVLEKGLPVAQLARLMGRRPQQLRRRIRKLIRHMEQPIYRFMILHADLLSPDTRRTAELVVFGVRSLRQAADELNLSLHQVREHMITVRAIGRL